MNIITSFKKKQLNPTPYEWGALYNFFALFHAEKLFSSDNYAIPTIEQAEELVTYAGGTLIAGNKLKHPSTEYWLNEGTGGNNQYNFSLFGAGNRNATTGNLINWRFSAQIATSRLIEEDLSILTVTDNAASANIVGMKNQTGVSVRGLKQVLTAEDILKSDGDLCDPYVGNDGKIYQTVKIGNQVWIKTNLDETKYRTGGTIAEITDNELWINDTAGAMCYYVQLP